MSEGAISKRRKPATGGKRKTPAERPKRYDEAAVERMCAVIREDGVTEEKAALLAGVEGEVLRGWKVQIRECRVNLGRARAEFHRQRLAEIRTTRAKEGVIDWRAQAWLLEHTRAEEEPTKRGEGTKGFVITQAHLNALQERRKEALRALEAQRPSAR